MNNSISPLCNRWLTFLVMGTFLILLGILALSSGFITTITAVVFLGLLLAASGIIQIIHSLVTPDWKGFFTQMLVGILSTVTGWLMVTRPAVGAVSITLILAVFFIAAGLFKIATALMVEVEQWGWLLFNGLITLALGVMIFVQWPAASYWIIGLFIAIDLIFSGWANIMLALRLRKICPIKSIEQ